MESLEDVGFFFRFTHGFFWFQNPKKNGLDFSWVVQVPFGFPYIPTLDKNTADSKFLGMECPFFWKIQMWNYVYIMFF